MNAQATGARLAAEFFAEPVQVHASCGEGARRVTVLCPTATATALKEMQVRVACALDAAHIALPRAVTVELAHVEPGLDLAVVAAILRLAEAPTSSARAPIIPLDTVFFGEVALDGRVRPVRGAVSALGLGCRTVVSARQTELRALRCPYWTVEHVSDLLGLPTVGPYDFTEPRRDAPRFDDIPARALLLGAPGVGKTMRARDASLRVSLSDEEFAVRRIYSAAGLEFRGAPFRAPHHTVSAAGMRGTATRPGEVALAHGGTLFLDELSEFSRQTLEATAEALRKWTPRRLYAAADACPRHHGAGLCACSPAEVARYRAIAIERAELLGIDTVIDLQREPWKPKNAPGVTP